MRNQASYDLWLTRLTRPPAKKHKVETRAEENRETSWKEVYAAAKRAAAKKRPQPKRLNEQNDAHRT
jgi:hypothetical protein